MPYKDTTKLPRAIRTRLPAHAQRIYMKAFNNAWEHYAVARKRRGKDTREETAHKVAWAAVEKSYEKHADGKWYRKSD